MNKYLDIAVTFFTVGLALGFFVGFILFKYLEV